MKYNDLDRCSEHENCRVLFHGTYYGNHQAILQEGLKGGDNTVGGNHGISEIPVLFTTPDLHVAKKYGHIVIIHLTEAEFNAFNFHDMNDGLGDKCLVLDGTDWDAPLIDSYFLSSPGVEWEEGFISDEELAQYTDDPQVETEYKDMKDEDLKAMMEVGKGFNLYAESDEEEKADLRVAQVEAIGAVLDKSWRKLTPNERLNFQLKKIESDDESLQLVPAAPDIYTQVNLRAVFRQLGYLFGHAALDDLVDVFLKIQEEL